MDLAQLASLRPALDSFARHFDACIQTCCSGRYLRTYLGGQLTDLHRKSAGSTRRRRSIWSGWGKGSERGELLLVEGKRVRLEYDVERRDKYGRTLAYVWIGDTMDNELLVHAGERRPSLQGARPLVVTSSSPPCLILRGCSTSP